MKQYECLPDKIPYRDRKPIRSLISLVTTVWNLNNCYVVKLLPKGSLSNSFYDISEILQARVIWQQGQREQTGPRFGHPFR
jgi:hypothetical protein